MPLESVTEAPSAAQAGVNQPLVPPVPKLAWTAPWAVVNRASQPVALAGTHPVAPSGHVLPVAAVGAPGAVAVADPEAVIETPKFAVLIVAVVEATVKG